MDGRTDTWTTHKLSSFHTICKHGATSLDVLKVSSGFGDKTDPYYGILKLNVPSGLLCCAQILGYPFGHFVFFDLLIHFPVFTSCSSPSVHQRLVSASEA